MKKYYLLLILFAFFFSTNQAQTFYYSSLFGSEIAEGQLDGSSAAVVLYDATDGINSKVRGVAYESSNDMIYWADMQMDQIRVAAADGTGTPTTVLSGLVDPNHIVVDAENNKIYWTEINNGIHVANLDGTGSSSQLFTSTRPRGLVLDKTNDKVYWADLFNEEILVGNADGTGTATVLYEATDGLDGPHSIFIDLANDLIYWSEVGPSNGGGNTGGNSICVAPLDGSGTRTVLFDSNNGVDNPRDILVDNNLGKIFWTNLTGGDIRSGNTDGTGTTTAVYTGILQPFGLATGSNAILPEAKLSLHAQKNDQSIDLSWESTSPAIEKFQVQTSMDGNNFSILANIELDNASLNSTNQYHIAKPATGLNYYRIMQTDEDGSEYFSNIVSVHISATNHIGEFFPNPSFDGKVSIAYDVELVNSLTIGVFDMQGQLVEQYRQDPIIENGALQLNLLGLTSGSYMIRIDDGNQVVNRRLLIQE